MKQRHKSTIASKLLCAAFLLPTLSSAATLGEHITAVGFDEESNPGTTIDAENHVRIMQNPTKLGYLWAGTWVKFKDFDLKNGSPSVTVFGGAPDGGGGTVEFRIGSEDGPVAGSVDISSTKSFDNFERFTGTFDSSYTGKQDLYLVFSGGYDIASFEINSPAADIQVGEFINGGDYDEESHPSLLDPIQKVDGGLSIGFIQDHSWVRYKNVDLGNGGISSLTIEGSRPNDKKTPGTVKVHLDHPDGEFIGYVNIDPTKGWEDYVEFTTDEISPNAQGVRDVYLVFVENGFNVKSFRFNYDPDQVGEIVDAISFDEESHPHPTPGAAYNILAFEGVYGATSKVGNIQRGNWIKFDSFDFGNGAASVTVSASTPLKGKHVDFYVAAPGTDTKLKIGRVEVNSTGSWRKSELFHAGLSGSAKGVRDLYLEFSGGLEIEAFMFNEYGKGLGLYSNGELLADGIEESPKYRFQIREVGADKWLPLHAWYTECLDHDPTLDGSAGGVRGYYTDFIGGWSNTYANFEMAKNTPVEIKVTSVPGSGITILPSTTVHPADKASISVTNGEAIVTLENPALFALDINSKLSSSNAPREIAGAYNAEAFSFRNLVGSTEDVAIHSVSIFANEFILDKPDVLDPSVYIVEAGGDLPPADDDSWDTLYFAPGVHNLGTGPDGEWILGDQLVIKDFKSYYIPGSALVYGNLNDNDDYTVSRFIKVYGHGTISGKKMTHPDRYLPDPDNSIGEGTDKSHKFRMLDIRKAQNCTYEGVSIIDQPYHGVYLNGEHQVGTKNLMKWSKIIGWRVNNDGMSAEGNGYIQDCFIRTQDDGTYVRGMAIQRMVYWSDVNGIALRTSFITNDRPESYPEDLPQELIVEDIDVIFARGVFGTLNGDGNSPDSFGIIGSPAGGKNALLPPYSQYRVNGETENTGQHIVFRNINFSDPNPHRYLFGFTGRDSGNGNYKEGDWAGLRFRDITVANTANFGLANRLTGATDPDQPRVSNIRDFVFDNVTIAGELVNADYLNDPTKVEINIQTNTRSFRFE